MDKEAELILSQMNCLEEDFMALAEDINNSYGSVISSIDNFSENVKRIDREFEDLTNLKREDYPFIIFCAGLQAFRQYFVTDFKERLTDRQAAKEVKGDKEEKSDRNKTRYYCSIKKIVSNPVPFDALEHDNDIKTGISGSNHRTTCLGHYPELGYVFGTANIMTSTITKKEGLANIQTYHVKTEAITRDYHYKKTGVTLSRTSEKDYIYSKAHTSKMFEHCYNRIKDNPQKGIPALVAALAKEHEHLRSDEKSKQSLPFPFLSFTPEMAEALRDYGLDYINVKTISKQAAYSYFVNLITEIIYYAYHIGKELPNVKNVKDIKIDNIVKVRLRKIINVANVISTTTNLAVVIVGIFIGNLDLIRKLDIGGELVTTRNLSNSADFMIKVKEEYILSEMNKINSKV